MIGGEHFLSAPMSVESSLGEQLEQELGHVSFFATGRDALATLLASLPGSTIQLPDLICKSIHDASQAAGKAREIYQIGMDFMHNAGVEANWQASTIVFVMHYFGVCNYSLIRKAKKAGLTVVSDVTHLLFDTERLKEVAFLSDFLIASLRKSGPFPDGGFVSSFVKHPVVPNRGFREEFFSLRASGLLSRGFSAKENFLDDENFLLLRKAEEILDESDPADFACSFFSRKLTHTISIPISTAAIRQNIAILTDGLRNYVDVSGLETLITPYFPCIFESTEKRNMVRKKLASRKIFCPVHWPSKDLPLPSPISDLILSIPCDARYDQRLMHFTVETIDSCLSS